MSKQLKKALRGEETHKKFYKIFVEWFDEALEM
jgi:hypothetical protein